MGTRLARDPDRGDGRGQLKAATRMLRAAQPRKTSLTGMSEKRPSPNLRDPHAHVLLGSISTGSHVDRAHASACTQG